MDKKQLLKQMLPGLIPILVFIIADEVWGTTVGIYVAVAIGIIQLIAIGIKEKRIEKFVLIDTALIVGMGGISVWLHDDVFFKLKPAIIEIILAIVLGISAFSGKNLLMMMSQRYIKNMELQQAQMQQMQKQLRVLFYLVVAHILMVVYAAYFLTTEQWGFVSTALFYIMIGIYFGIVFLHQYFKNKNTEWLPVVDEEGRVIGKATREECHRNPDLMYPVVRLHIINSQKQILLQKRSFKSDIEPGKWDAAVAGHVHFGEEIGQAVLREAREEINFTPEYLDLLEKRIFNAPTSTSLMFIFITQSDSEIEANKKEVEEVRWFSLSQVINLEKQGELAIGTQQEIKLLRPFLS
jgi:intracellular septation protein A/8-oxo-dGTP pyrophosphatase MutT (NUDIX family)